MRALSRRPELVALGSVFIGMAIGLGKLIVGRLASSEAMLADATDRVADVLATIGVLAGLAGVRMGLTWADSAAALLVSVIIARAAGRVAWRSGDILIDRAATDVEKQLQAAI